jgi:hypothetical protein
MDEISAYEWLIDYDSPNTRFGNENDPEQNLRSNVFVATWVDGTFTTRDINSGYTRSDPYDVWLVDGNVVQLRFKPSGSPMTLTVTGPQLVMQQPGWRTHAFKRWRYR